MFYRYRFWEYSIGSCYSWLYCYWEIIFWIIVQYIKIYIYLFLTYVHGKYYFVLICVIPDILCIVVVYVNVVA